MRATSQEVEGLPDDRLDGQAAITVRDAGKTYFSKKGQRFVAIEDISLTINQGEIVSFIGPSGCGKSTLLMLISGLYRVTNGRVEVHGRNVTKPSNDVGVVFQQDLLLDWRNVIDNVLLPFVMTGQNPAPHRQRARDYLARVGLEGFEEKRPFELSGGMRQRVALCRGLIQDPSVILLDEPFAALDALTREQMQHDVQNLWGSDDKTAVIVTHDIAEAVFMSDKIVVMNNRPSSIYEIVHVDLPRPRTAAVRESPEFSQHHSYVHGLFKDLGVFS